MVRIAAADRSPGRHRMWSAQACRTLATGARRDTCKSRRQAESFLDFTACKYLYS